MKKITLLVLLASVCFSACQPKRSQKAILRKISAINTRYQIDSSKVARNSLYNLTTKQYKIDSLINVRQCRLILVSECIKTNRINSLDTI